jgi:hypothetical protein
MKRREQSYSLEKYLTENERSFPRWGKFQPEKNGFPGVGKTSARKKWFSRSGENFSREKMAFPKWGKLQAEKKRLSRSGEGFNLCFWEYPREGKIEILGLVGYEATG